MKTSPTPASAKPEDEPIVAMVATHRVVIPKLNKRQRKALKGPVILVEAPLNVGVIEEELPGGWVAVRFERPAHIAAYPKDWVTPLEGGAA